MIHPQLNAGAQSVYRIRSQIELIGRRNLEFHRLEFSVSGLVVEKQGAQSKFGVIGKTCICRKRKSTERNADTSPLIAVIAMKTVISLESATVSRILKNGIIIELRPMYVLSMDMEYEE